MIKLNECGPLELYTQLSSRALAVLVSNGTSFTVYVDGVPGLRHDLEWLEVRKHGQAQRERLARAIVATLFHPGFDTEGMRYDGDN